MNRAALLYKQYQASKWKIRIKMPNDEWAEFLYSNGDVAERHYREFLSRESLAGNPITNIQLIEMESVKG
jgi:hypothetical protein